MEGRWRPPAPAAGWRGGMGMPRTSCGLGADDVGETAETGKPAKGDGSYCYKATIDVRGTP